MEFHQRFVEEQCQVSWFQTNLHFIYPVNFYVQQELRYIRVYWKPSDFIGWKTLLAETQGNLWITISTFDWQIFVLCCILWCTNLTNKCDNFCIIPICEEFNLRRNKIRNRIEKKFGWKFQQKGKIGQKRLNESDFGFGHHITWYGKKGLKKCKRNTKTETII